MPVIVNDSPWKRGEADAKRHRDKQREAVKKKLPGIILSSGVITKGVKNRVVRVPITEIEIPIFRHGTSSGKPGGLGQGKGGVGDILDKRPISSPSSSSPGSGSSSGGGSSQGKGQGKGQGQKGQGNKSGQGSQRGGNTPGEIVYTEMPLEEAMEMVFEDLGLPNLRKKNSREIFAELGYRLRGIALGGPQALLHKRKTVSNGIKRFWAYLRTLEKKMNKGELECFRALKQSGGNLEKALKLIQDGAVTEKAEKVSPFPIIHQDDLRYHKIEDKKNPSSRAVIFPIMDISGSMDEGKRYIACVMLLWLKLALEKIYDKLDIRFIVHHTEAKLVSEEEFFTASSPGGTLGSSAYELVGTLLDSEYPTSDWNVYVWHSSDGDDFSSEKAVASLAALFEKLINLFGYCDIRPGLSEDELGGLLAAYREAFNLKVETGTGCEMFVGDGDKVPFLGARIRRKEDVWPALRAFLKQNRWRGE